MKWFKWLIELLSSNSDILSKFAIVIDYKKRTMDSLEKRTKKTHTHIDIHPVLIISVLFTVIYLDI